MLARIVVTLTAALLVAAPAGAATGQPLPEGLRGAKPYQVVERILDQRDVLGLSETQVAGLEALRHTIRTEPHRFVHRGGKPHRTRHVPMISRGQAYGRALAVLTPQQQDLARSLLQAKAATVESPIARPRRGAPGKP